MTTAGEVCSIDEIFSDVSPIDETSLVPMNKQRDERFKSVCEKFCNSFWWAVLKRDGSESVSSSSYVFFGEEYHKGAVETLDVGGMVMEGMEEGKYRVFEKWPEFPVEGRPKSVRTRTGIRIHLKESILNFLLRERLIERTQLRNVVRIKKFEVEAPKGGLGRANEVCVKIFENQSFLIVGEEVDAVVFKN